ncbi:MAG: winged helix-turn-helix transcriptional regulator [Solirubrobacterales bacterium]|nr:winged helix-turn-helix transcriptional regulator [Solirubrobacterales bacterium]
MLPEWASREMTQSRSRRDPAFPEWDELVRISDEFKAMSSPVRLKLLFLFETRHQHRSVTQLAERIDESLTLTSHHLRKAVNDGLLESQVRGEFAITEKGRWWLEIARLAEGRDL